MEFGQALIIGLFGLSFATGLGFVIYVSREQAQTIADLEAKLDVFVDTSINVARSVDKLSAQGVEPKDTISSRRWLMEEARTRVKQGEHAVAIGRSLGLSGDEVRLLRMTAAQAHASA